MNMVLRFHNERKERLARIEASAARLKERSAAVDAMASAIDALTEQGPADPDTAPPLVKRKPWFRMLGMDAPAVRDIQECVAEFYGHSYTDLVSSRREQPLTFHRQVAMMITKQVTKKSLPEIGRLFGGRDHTTVLHGVRKAEAVYKDDIKLQSEVGEIRLRLEGL